MDNLWSAFSVGEPVDMNYSEVEIPVVNQIFPDAYKQYSFINYLSTLLAL